MRANAIDSKGLEDGTGVCVPNGNGVEASEAIPHVVGHVVLLKVGQSRVPERPGIADYGFAVVPPTKKLATETDIWSRLCTVEDLIASDDKNVDMLPDVALARVDAEKTEASLIFDVHRSSLINSCGNEGTPSRASKPDIGLNPSKKVLEPSSCVPEPRHARGRLVVNEKDLVSQRFDH